MRHIDLDYVSKAIVGIASPVVGLITSFQERSSAGTAGAGVSVETGWRVKSTEGVADRTAPAVVQTRLVRLLNYCK